MNTDADGNIIFYTSKGKFNYYGIVILLLLCSVIPLAIAGYGIIPGAGWLGLTVFGSIFLLILIFIVLIAMRIRCIFECDGIRLPLNFVGYGFIPDFIPYSSIRKFYESREWTHHLYGFSFDQIVIRFINSKGRNDGISVSPKDKQLFISELTKRTGIPLTLNPYPKKK
ncbi:MAG: PH domain-containing protein [Methanomassiliicoccaceae archaeon]|nr:PH domain-containing protein [Methanomassiliicoccaceae archaeon]